MRVRVFLGSGEVAGDGHFREAAHVGRVDQVLPEDHRGGVRQRERQAAQFPRDRPRPGVIVQAGPLRQVRGSLVRREHVHRHGLAEAGQGCPRAGDDHLAVPGGGKERPQYVGAGGVVQHDQAPVTAGFEPVPHPQRGVLRVRRVSSQAKAGGELRVPSQQLLTVLGVQPRHHAPALVQALAGARGGDLALADPPQPGHREHHAHPVSGRRIGEGRQQVGAVLERGRPLRDLPDDQRARSHPGTRSARLSVGAGRVIDGAAAGDDRGTREVAARPEHRTLSMTDCLP